MRGLSELAETIDNEKLLKDLDYEVGRLNKIINNHIYMLKHDVPDGNLECCTSTCNNFARSLEISRLNTDCPRCHGSGWRYWSDEHESQCLACFGSGKIGTQ